MTSQAQFNLELPASDGGLAQDYFWWNDRLAEFFFSSDCDGKNVYLTVTKDVIRDLAENQEDGYEGFISQVKAGPYVSARGLCQTALKLYQEWKDERKREFPPYVAYLCLFVLAVEHGGEEYESGRDYYRRLRNLLGEKESLQQYPSFDKMWELWLDLQQWANDDRLGELGVFTDVCVGTNSHVGYPKAQRLLSRDELDQLCDIFNAAGMDPDNPPSDEAMARHVVVHGKEILRSRTGSILRGYKDKELKQSLVAQLNGELENWDGDYYVDLTEGRTGKTRTSSSAGQIVLFMRINPATGSVNMDARFKAKKFPDEAFDVALGEIITCEEEAGRPGWSKSLKINANELDWLKGVKAKAHIGAEEKHLTFRLAGAPVRVFREARRERFAGYVEDRKLPRGGKFYVAVHEKHLEEIKDWGRSSCNSWVEFETNGLPVKWRLFEANNAKSPHNNTEDFGVLSWDTMFSVRPHNFIKSGSSKTFFGFGLPELEISTEGEIKRVHLDEKELSRIEKTNSFEITELPSQGENTIVIEEEGEQDDHTWKFKIIDEDPRWLNVKQTKRFDALGRATGEEGHEGQLGTYTGTEVSAECPSFDWSSCSPSNESERVIFVGCNPGEISNVDFMQDLSWRPVWAVDMRRKGKAVYLLNKIMPPTKNKVGLRKDIKDWKKLLWNNRKRITPPFHRRLAILWSEYVKNAKNV